MWVGKDQFNTIAYPLNQLPRVSVKRELVAGLSRSELSRRRRQADDLLDELRSAVGDPVEGSGHVGEQVNDNVIESVDWQRAIVGGDFSDIRSAEEWWRIDLAEILDDLLHEGEVD
jgi:hypothetical protein